MGRVLISLFLLVIVQLSSAKASDEITSILNTANDLTLQEVNALRPLFNEFQKQYDAIRSALGTESSNDILPWQEDVITEPAIADYVHFLEGMLTKPSVGEPSVSKYDTSLPMLGELVDAPVQTKDMTAEQVAELNDLHQIMQESLDEAQAGINALVKRALHLETEMLKLNKPKILEYIYKALSVLFRYSAQLRRAAYCTYSHVPQLNESLQNLNAGVECYAYTKNLIVTVENEVTQTITTIRRNVYDLAKIYKKIAAKNSIVGKIVTAILNIFSIMSDVRQTLAAATKAIDGLENQLPNAAGKSIHCGLDFVDNLPFMLETAVNVTTCVTYVEAEKEIYEFLLPENERNLKLDDSK